MFTDRLLTTIFIAGILILSTFASKNVEARNQTQTIEEKVKRTASTFEAMLNAKSDPEELMEFMHNTISNDVQITLIINSPEEKQTTEIERKLTKAEYINSYLYGPRQVENYHASIKTMDINVGADNKTVTSKEIMTESGTIKNPHNYKDKGREFISRTVCNLQRTLDSRDNLILQLSTCKTEISYPEEA